jgi:RNA polymerase subunit RPABC4/transcription elongation factor Spt4
MAYCANCGSVIPEGTNSCPSCGKGTALQSAALSTYAIVPEPAVEEVKRVNSVIPLAEGETILWHRESTQGLIHKEVTMEEAVTNRRCLKYDVKNKQVTAQIGLNNGPEIVVMNLHRINDSLGGGIFLTPRMFGLPGLGGFGVYGGPRRGNLKVFGDISFMYQSKVVLTFENVKDPQGVRQLVMALERELGSAAPWRAGRPGIGGRMRPRQP